MEEDEFKSDYSIMDLDLLHVWEDQLNSGVVPVTSDANLTSVMTVTANQNDKSSSRSILFEGDTQDSGSEEKEKRRSYTDKEKLLILNIYKTEGELVKMVLEDLAYHVTRTME